MIERRASAQTLRLNERIKHAVGVATAWGNALFIGGFGTRFVRGFGADAFLSILAASVLMLVASRALTLLNAEQLDE